jgi:hypothetical protein
VFTSAGYSALDVAETLTDRADVVAARWIRIGIVVFSLSVLVVVTLLTRRAWSRTLKFLAVMGYLFTGMAVLRAAAETYPIARAAGNRLSGLTTSSGVPPASTSIPPRQVVWLILDELDFDETLGRTPGAASLDPPMPNLEHLAKVGVSASNAYPPARDTIVSLPALLTGYDLSGIRFDPGGLTLKTRDLGESPFDQANSLFSRLPDGPKSAALLGFYHPYCSLFPSVSPCSSFPKDNVARWFDALTVFVQPLVAGTRWLPGAGSLLPEFVYRAFEPMYRISANTLSLYPKYVSIRDKSMVFIHVNLPHTPGDYSQRLFRTRDAGDDRTEYRRNLRLVDQLLDQTLGILSSREKDQKILLIVSSDHWHRINSPLHARRVPWIAWRVGETHGESIPEPISTLYTGGLIEAFLAGDLDDQAQIAGWWSGKPVHPTLMPHGFSYE